jgi:NAD(P)H dehydrogenase (quinone)
MNMADIVVVFHSGYGHTQRVAQAVAESAGAQLLAIDADGNLPEGGWEMLAAADAIIFGSPTYMGSVSWQFKKFADASSKVWFTQGWKDKLFAGFTNSAGMNGDKGHDHDLPVDAGDAARRPLGQHGHACRPTTRPPRATR